MRPLLEVYILITKISTSGVDHIRERLSFPADINVEGPGAA
jgi:hypothetical protein